MEKTKEIGSFNGLTDEEAFDLLKKNGLNELPSSARRNIFKILLDIFKEPMFLLLLGGGLIYLILGDWREALLLLFFVLVVISITLVQENKAEQALDALRNLSSPRALVIRQGVQKRIPGREVVSGDLMIIHEGDRVPADAVLIWGFNIMADESLLTGESVAVRKSTTETEAIIRQKPGGDNLPFLYSGTLIVGGQGVAKVIATGLQSEIGKIGLTLQGIKQEDTALQQQIKKLVKTVFIAALALCFLIIIIFGFFRGGWLEGILYGITLAMAILPEEFPMVLAIFLAMGAWRLSQKKILTRQLNAVETLGSATILCVDKTGTLTHNIMAVQKLISGEEEIDLKENIERGVAEKYQPVIEYAIMAGKRHPFDPMEKAIENLGKTVFQYKNYLHDDWILVREYSLSKESLALVNVWQTADKQSYRIAAKGAPETILDLCHLNEEKKKLIGKQITSLAEKGLRVIGIANAQYLSPQLPAGKHDFEFEFLGLIGLADHIRDDVPSSIEMCHQAGIRVIMITGDYLITARNIAQQIGLGNTEKILSGEDLAKISPEELQSQIKKIDIFARIMPEQKLSIINALKANGEVVAMTGDGVNDAPALKAANIGIAMGERGTDVAREAADLIVLDDDFSSIVDAVRLGRKIYDNLRKAMAYIISVHIPIAGISLLPLLLGWPIILYPMHIVFLELIIDPACSIAFEAERAEKNIMNRPPRNPREPLFPKRIFIISLLQGIFSLLVVALVLKLALLLGQTETEARTLTFVTLIISNLFLLLTNRSWSKNIFYSLRTPNPSLVWIFCGALTCLFITIYTPFLQHLFHFSAIHFYDLIFAVIAGIISIGWFEILKLILRLKNLQLLS